MQLRGEGILWKVRLIDSPPPAYAAEKRGEADEKCEFPLPAYEAERRKCSLMKGMEIGLPTPCLFGHKEWKSSDEPWSWRGSYLFSDPQIAPSLRPPLW